MTTACFRSSMARLVEASGIWATGTAKPNQKLEKEFPRPALVCLSALDKKMA